MDELTDLPTALRLASAIALGMVVCWTLLIAVLASGRHTAGLARRLTPPALRFLLTVGMSSTLTCGPTPVHADELDGLQLPDRPVTTIELAGTGHLVRPGDSLWTIASAALGTSDLGAVAQQTTRWYQANRDTIGPDPDLIRPGQRLVAPSAGVAR